MADGDITLSVKLSTEDVQAKASKLQNQIKNIFAQADTSKIDASTQKVLADLDKLANKSEMTIAKMREMENTQVDNPWLTQAKKDCEALWQELTKVAEATAKREEYFEGGFRIYHSEEDQAQLDAIMAKIREAEKAIEKAPKTVSLVDAQPEKYEQLKNSLNEINNQMTINIAKAQQSGQVNTQTFEQVAGKVALAISAFAHLKTSVEQSGSGMSKIGAVMNSIGGVMAKLPGVGTKLGSAFQSMGNAISQASKDTEGGAKKADGILQGLGNVAKKVGSGIVSAFKGVGKVVGNVAVKAKQVASAIGKTLANAFSKVKGLAGKAFGGATRSMDKFVKKLAVVTLGARGLITLFRKLYTSIKDGFNNIAQFEGVSGKTTQAMASMQASLAYLKGAWAAAFAPVYNVVMPILSALVDKLAVVGNAVARFMGVLTGQATVVNAVRGSTNDYAKALDKANKSSGGASKASKQLSDRLASFDKLNVLGKDKDSDASGGGGGGAESAIDPSKMFENVSAVSKLGDMIKDAIKSGFDFTDVGVFIGDKIANMLNSIPWGKIQTGAQNIGKGIATFLNGALGDPAIWESVGNTVAQGLNTITYFISSFLTNMNLDWGGGLASLIGKFFTEVDWGTIQSNIVTFADHIRTNLTSLLSGLNWEDIRGALGGVAKSIGSAIGSILGDPELMAEVGKSAGNIINGLGEILSGIFSGGGGGLATMLANAVSTIDFGGVAQAFADNLNNFFVSLGGGDLEKGISGLFGGITEFITTLFTNIDWAYIGELIISGIDSMMVGIQTALESSDNPVLQSLGSIVGTIRDIFNELVPVVAEVISAILPIIQALLPVIQEILSAVVPIIQALLPVIQQIVEALIPIVEAILPVIQTLLPPIVSIISKVAEIVMAILPYIVSFIEQLLPIITRLIDAILPVVMSVLEALQPVLETFCNVILPIIVELLDMIMPLIEGIMSFVQQILPPIIALLEPLIQLIGAILQPLMKILAPIFEILGVIFDLLGAILGPIIELISPLLELLTEVLSPLFEIFGAIAEVIGQVLTPIFKAIAAVIKAVIIPIFNAIITVVQKVVEWFKKIGEVFKNVFDGIKKVLDKVVGFFKGIVNAVLGAVEGFVNFFIRAINKIPEGLNKLSFDVPDWVPGIGGKRIGFNLKTISEISIPRLAQGAVIPPNREFMAVLGDQPHGTNIEAPLDTIKQAVAEVMVNNRDDEVVRLLQQLIKVVDSKELVIGDKEIGKANARYKAEQDLIKGVSF